MEPVELTAPVAAADQVAEVAVADSRVQGEQQGLRASTGPAE